MENILYPWFDLSEAINHFDSCCSNMNERNFTLSDLLLEICIVELLQYYNTYLMTYHHLMEKICHSLLWCGSMYENGHGWRKSDLKKSWQAGPVVSVLLVLTDRLFHPFFSFVELHGFWGYARVATRFWWHARNARNYYSIEVIPQYRKKDETNDR